MPYSNQSSKRDPINLNSATQREFRLLYDKYFLYIAKIVSNRINNQDDANEVISDIFMKVFLSLNRYDSQKGNFKSWIATIAINSTRDYLRKKNNKTQVTSLSDIEIIDTKREAIEEELLVQQILSRLQSSDKNLLEERFLRERDINEIAKRERSNPDSIYKRIQRIIKRLRQP